MPRVRVWASVLLRAPAAQLHGAARGAAEQSSLSLFLALCQMSPFSPLRIKVLLQCVLPAQSLCHTQIASFYFVNWDFNLETAGQFSLGRKFAPSLRMRVCQDGRCCWRLCQLREKHFPSQNRMQVNGCGGRARQLEPLAACEERHRHSFKV